MLITFFKETLLKKTNWRIVGICLTLFLFALYILLAGKTTVNSLKSDGFLLTTGIVYDFGRQYGNGPYVRYRYNVSNQILHNSEFTYIDRNRLLGHTFPVAYSRKDSSISMLLLENADFEAIGLLYPDSLK